MKKWLDLGVTVLVALSLAACGNQKTASSASSHNSSQSAIVASLKKENTALKKSHSSQTDSKKTSSVAQESSRSSQIAKAASSCSTPQVNNEGSSAATIKNGLVQNFGCETAAVNAIPDATIIQISNASSGAGEDIGGFYKRVKAQYPDVGGNVLGPNAATSDSGGRMSEDAVPWDAGARASFDASWSASYSDQTITGFEKYSADQYSVYVAGRDSPYVTVNIHNGNFHG